MKNEFRNLIFLFLFAFAIRVFFLFFVQVRYWDETVYLSLAKDLARNFFNYSLNGAFWGDFIPFGHGLYNWPNIGFRAPLLPVTLSFFYRLHLSSLIEFFIPIIASLNSILVYFLGKKMFNSKVGIYSAVLFSIVPINLLWGFRISTEIYGLFFLLLSFLFFWKGFEEKHNLSKILFGIFLGLALLTRYTTMWIIPLFLIYFLIRDKNLKFLRDKYLWFSILAFFVVLIPWFVYGMVFYSNPLGAFIHGTIGASFWGGIQSGFFYFIYFWRNFSLIGIGFVVSLIYFCNKKLLKDKQIHFLLIWFLLIFLIASFMPHKEERFILILVPSLCLLLGVFINKIDEKILKWFNKNRFLGFVLLIFCFLIVLFPVFLNFYSEESTGTSYCFSKGLNFIKHLNDNALIYSDETPIVYAYTDKCTRFYPNPWNVTYLERGENNFIIYTDYDRPLYLEENVLFREELSNNFELVFSCDEDWGITEVYKIGN